MMRYFNAVARIFALAMLMALAGPGAAQQAYPVKPLRVVVPFPPGGPTDIVGRLVAQRLSEALGQVFIIDNRPGASGMIGADIVAKAAPDGYTLLISASSHVINPSLYSKVPHDALRDFAPVTNLAFTPLLLVVSVDLPVRSAQELIAYIKANPGKLSFASSSLGAPGHLAAELLKLTHGLDVIHVPYKGSSPALIDLTAGRSTFMFDSMPSAIGFVRGGKLRSLGVTAEKRSPAAPELPTLVELGFKDFVMTAWYGLWAPARTPTATVNELHAAAARVLAAPDMRTRLIQQLGAEPLGESPEAFAAFSKSEAQRYARIVKASGAKLE